MLEEVVVGHSLDGRGYSSVLRCRGGDACAGGGLLMRDGGDLVGNLGREMTGRDGRGK